MRTGMAAKMTRLPVPVLLRWPSWMRSDPRSGFAETCEVAMGRGLLVSMQRHDLGYVRQSQKITQMARYRIGEPIIVTPNRRLLGYNYRIGEPIIVTQQSAIRAEIPF